MRRSLLIFLGGMVLLGVVCGGVAWWLLQGQPVPAIQAESNAAPTATPFNGSEARATLLARRGTDTPFPPTALPPTSMPSVTAYTFDLTPEAVTTPVSTSGSIPGSITADQKTLIDGQLAAAWASYRQQFIEPSGRVVDLSANNVTTSEGQSYALLRAVWSNDRATFDRVLDWTYTNLQPANASKLFAYKWGKDDSGEWKVLDPASASDADSDIALALVFAARRWNDLKYWKLALDVITAVWEKEVVMVADKPYLSAGDWAPARLKVPLNPSYLAPYAMRIFATLDPYHNWLGLVDTSYEVIQGCSQVELDGVKAVKLPANWCGIDRRTALLTVAQDYPRLDTNYGYDAFRTMWRVALDYRWFGEKRALDYLTWSDTLRLKWKQNGKLAAVYGYGGQVNAPQEDLAVYSGDLANFALTEPGLAWDLVAGKLLPTYRNADNRAVWGDAQNYYSQNWVWFGLAFYANSLPNLATGTWPQGR